MVSLIGALLIFADSLGDVCDTRACRVIMANVAPDYCSHNGIREAVWGDDSQNVQGLTMASSYGGAWWDEENSLIIDVVIPGADTDYVGCPYMAIGFAADDAALAAGVDPTSFMHRAYMLPGGAVGCDWPGQAGVGTALSYYRVQHPGVIAHELGHNMGAAHAGTDPEDDGIINDEYGDNSGVMGGPFIGPPSYNGPHRRVFGWLDEDRGITEVSVAIEPDTCDDISEHEQRSLGLSCSSWAALGICDSSRWMVTNCRRSCVLCSNTTASPAAAPSPAPTVAVQCANHERLIRISAIDAAPTTPNHTNPFGATMVLIKRASEWNRYFLSYKSLRDFGGSTMDAAWRSKVHVHAMSENSLGAIEHSLHIKYLSAGEIFEGTSLGAPFRVEVLSIQIDYAEVELYIYGCNPASPTQAAETGSPTGEPTFLPTASPRQGHSSEPTAPPPPTPPTARPSDEPCADGSGRMELVFRQTMPFMQADSGWLSHNPANPANPNFSILASIESFRKADGTFELEISWPADTDVVNHWSQSSSPLVAGVTGYHAISIGTTDIPWRGLELSASANTLLDGWINNDTAWQEHVWWYAIGTQSQHNGGIPGPNSMVVSVAELRACVTATAQPTNAWPATADPTSIPPHTTATPTTLGPTHPPPNRYPSAAPTISLTTTLPSSSTGIPTANSTATSTANPTANPTIFLTANPTANLTANPTAITPVNPTTNPTATAVSSPTTASTNSPATLTPTTGSTSTPTDGQTSVSPTTSLSTSTTSEPTATTGSPTTDTPPSTTAAPPTPTTSDLTATLTSTNAPINSMPSDTVISGSPTPPTTAPTAGSHLGTSESSSDDDDGNSAIIAIVAVFVIMVVVVMVAGAQVYKQKAARNGQTHTMRWRSDARETKPPAHENAAYEGGNRLSRGSSTRSVILDSDGTFQPGEGDGGPMVEHAI